MNNPAHPTNPCLPDPATVAARLDSLLAPLLIVAARFRILRYLAWPLWNRIARMHQLFDRALAMLALIAAGGIPPASGAETGHCTSAPDAVPAAAIGMEPGAGPARRTARHRAPFGSTQAPPALPRAAGRCRAAPHVFAASTSAPPPTPAAPAASVNRAAMRALKCGSPKIA